MKRIFTVAAGLLFILSAAAMAAAPKSYQVTGPVIEVKDDVIVVQNKDGEKWEIAKDKDTKATGDVKVGAKVTIKYQMKAVNIEVK